MKPFFLGAVALLSCAFFICSCASNQKTKPSISAEEAVNNICLYDFVDLEVAKDGFDADELFALGKNYEQGNGVEQDVEKALSLYEYVATVLKSGNGYSALAKVYEAKDGTYPNITHSMDKALEYFRLSFEGEDLESKDFKGPRYLADYFDSGYEKDDGTFVAPDYAKAEKYYLLASDENGRTFDGTSCYKLGTYYEDGRAGVTQDFSKAALERF